ncbi:methyltransferase domain-containing protein [Viridibacillus sp. YIM B01967]|uniref:Methyltransferase domain-containing protein n=1 Tax=Viridibacillus soli TaxID=2798301 RepID=A0ABS1H5H3_9BACL|nr:methyltransferase domain-containing protein [Viridibacillus soli]MBK3494663.1 methyltransferase domain-containing protein [Viridibacillus soli]
MALPRKVASANYMREREELFACPVCGSEMMVTEDCSIVCDNRHSFDIAKQGYVNFMTHAATSMYGKGLFEARKQVIESGLYAPMHTALCDLLKQMNTNVVVLDTGCGEGSHLASIKNEFQEQSDHSFVGVGIDIAKEGIIAAGRNYDDMIWCVGDLAKSPYQQTSFNAILNILSPANYTEFKRLLKPNGMVIKVVPQSGYLQQLRAMFFADSEKESYSNELTVERFKENFREVEIKRIAKTIAIDQELVPLLMHMTPMGWHQNNNDTAINLTEITIDLDILVGKI